MELCLWFCPSVSVLLYHFEGGCDLVEFCNIGNDHRNIDQEIVTVAYFLQLPYEVE